MLSKTMCYAVRTLPIMAVSIFSVGCQNTPTNSSVETTQPTSVQAKNPLAGTPPTGGLMESSYVCLNAQDSTAMVSVFYDSRPQTTTAATLRINDSDYPMSLLSQGQSQNNAYISQQQNENGQHLIWQTSKTQPQAAQLSISSSTNPQELTVLYQCKVTR